VIRESVPPGLGRDQFQGIAKKVLARARYLAKIARLSPPSVPPIDVESVKRYLLARASRSKLRVALACSLCSVGVVLALMSVRATPPMLSGVPGAWSIVPSPNRDNGSEGNRLGSVACASASDCWTVGYHLGDNGGTSTLIEHWNGTSWSVVSSPDTAADNNELSSVTCNSASDCWAVGYSGSADVSQTLVEHWDGASWSIVSSPNTATENNYLSSVTCNSASDCWAVGYHYPNNGFIGQTLVEHWNGVSWSIVSSPNTSPTQGNHLLSVTCSSASDCWAVGEYADDNVDLTLIEKWNGTSWTIVSSPNPTQFSRLFSVACSSASDCWAVGTYHDGTYYQTLIERWNGASWAVVNSSSPGNKRLNSVTCASGSDCWAVGFTSNPSTLANSTRVEHWDGVSWSLVNSANTAPNRNNELAGVVCTSSGCWAVGLFNNSRTDQTLIEHWNGSSWAITASPSINNGIRGNGLDGATCTSRSNCWAVGSYSQEADSPFSFAYTLIERWNGTSWQTIESPSVAAINNGLRDVACSSQSDCWAVGSIYNSGVQYHQTLIEHWDGNSWSIVPSPNATNQNRLNGVACSSASNCWAVGFVSDTSHTLTLIQHWNGSAWSIVPSPNVFASDNFLYSVTCSSDSDCWAVGNSENSGATQPLIQHWNGSAWTIVASPNPFGSGTYLNSITCTSGSDCWAVGWGVSSGSSPRTLTEHWDGASWSVVSSPNTGTVEPNYLDGVACASASNCSAVGHYYSSAGVNQSLIVQWDGTSWTIANSPTLSAQEPQSLNGTACVLGSDCWAVGVSGFPFIERTLIERFAIPVQVSGIASRRAHGSGGETFDVDLSGGATECRSGGPNGDYTMVFTFTNELTNVGSAAVASGTGGVTNAAIGSDRREYIVNLAGVSNAQIVTVTLSGISDSAGNFSNSASASMNVLFGDVNGSGGVSASDVNLAKAQIGAVLSPDNFRADVNANGSVTSSDINLIKTQIGTSISSSQVAQRSAIQSPRK
jgi:hypothetical protein